MDERKPPNDVKNASQTQCRVRIYFRKEDAVKYISNLDMLRAWERAIRRSGLPLAYSLGFNPHPKITIAMPLAVGCTGENEALDIILTAPTPDQEVIRALGPAMPPGLSAISAEAVELKSPALATLFLQAVYRIHLVDIAEDKVKHRITDLLEQETVPVEFRRKRFDLRPLIGSLKVSGVHPPLTLHAVLLRDDRGRIGRPDVLLQALGLGEHGRQVHRTRIVYRT